MNIFQAFRRAPVPDVVVVVSVADRWAAALALEFHLTAGEARQLVDGDNPFAPFGLEVVDGLRLVDGASPYDVMATLVSPLTVEEVTAVLDRFDAGCAWDNWRALHRRFPAAG